MPIQSQWKVASSLLCVKLHQIHLNKREISIIDKGNRVKNSMHFQQWNITSWFKKSDSNIKEISESTNNVDSLIKLKNKIRPYSLKFSSIIHQIHWFREREREANYTSEVTVNWHKMIYSRLKWLWSYNELTTSSLIYFIKVLSTKKKLKCAQTWPPGKSTAIIIPGPRRPFIVTFDSSIGTTPTWLIKSTFFY